jgi:hypothetical protein
MGQITEVNQSERWDLKFRLTQTRNAAQICDLHVHSPCCGQRATGTRVSGRRGGSLVPANQSGMTRRGWFSLTSGMAAQGQDLQTLWLFSRLVDSCSPTLRGVVLVDELAGGAAQTARPKDSRQAQGG